jgi:hypothetical protein
VAEGKPRVPDFSGAAARQGWLMRQADEPG